MARVRQRPLFFHSQVGSYSDGWGEVTDECRDWEDAYRDRWAHDKIVRSTHGVNCTGSCSWKIYVKNGIVTWETQETDYPPTPAGVPNHEPRGCPRGASYSWYLYSAARLKHPLVRAELLEAWRKARGYHEPVEAWKWLVEQPNIRESYVKSRGLGGFVRASWDEVTELVAAANLYTVETYGPDRIAGFTPIPAYSMVSYGSGTRYLTLMGGATLSFYDWYCDLPTSSPQTWGEQTDVPESEAWYYASYLIVWGTNISMTRTPDAHFMNESRYHGMKLVNICPDYCETTKDADWWIHPRPSTDAALAMAMNHVVMKEFHLDNPDPYFTDYCRRLTDLPLLVRLDKRQEGYIPGRTLRASDLGGSGEIDPTHISDAEWKTVVWDEFSDSPAIPQGSIGYRWHQEEGADLGKWNLNQIDGETGRDIKARLSLLDNADEVVDAYFPYFGGEGGDTGTCETVQACETASSNNMGSSQTKSDLPHDRQLDAGQRFVIPAVPGGDILVRKVPVKRMALADGEVLVVTVFDLMASYLGIDRGLGGCAAQNYEDDVPFTPKWQERITGVPAADAITLAREFARAASETHGRACVCVGAGVNQWYQTDNTYRAIIDLLLLCGTCGVPGGGWCHYVGQEKIRPEAGWAAYAFAKDWEPAARQMNSTSFFYEHTDQWRYERMPLSDMLSPLADQESHSGTYLDYNVSSEMMGWLPSAPQLGVNPVALAKEARHHDQDPAAYAAQQLKSRTVRFCAEDPDAPRNWPRNLFVWRSNLLGSSGKGQEYFLKHLLGTQDGVIGGELGDDERSLRPKLVRWRDAPIGKLDLLVTIDFRMSTTALYADVVLPAATFYEKNDINTTDMHSFVHPFVKAVSCPWEAKSDWEVFKHLARQVSRLAAEQPERFGAVEDLVLTPLGHDSAFELGQPLEVKRWYEGECDFEPGVTAPHITLVHRDYRQIFDKLCSVGPLLSEKGGGNRGIGWSLDSEIDELVNMNGVVRAGVAKGRPRMESDIDAANFILRVSPETNGTLAHRSWDAVKRQSGVDGSFLSETYIGSKPTFEDLGVRPFKTLTAPDWSGTESSEIPYVAFWQNVNLLLPWRTLSGRQHFYQDHQWMRDFGQSFPQYRPAANQRSVKGFKDIKPNGNPAIEVNFMTVHQKWGIHSTYFENERMLSLSRGGPVIWVSAKDAQRAGIVDNDWVEAWNANGTVVSRAIVSSRLPEGLSIMQHATEKIVNTPGSEITNIRGGDHNAPTRIIVNPTHMIGGYAQLSYAFNYYGTICPNRDEFVWLRKMKTVDWMEG